MLAVVGRPSKVTGDERWITEATAPPLLVTSTAEAREVPGCETVVVGDAVTMPATLDALTALAKRISDVLAAPR